jgi:hypothetical protein
MCSIKGRHLRIAAFFLLKASAVNRLRANIWLVLFIFASGGCRSVNSPREAFDAVAVAAEEGDEAVFLDGFTESSRALLRGMFALSDESSAHFKLGDFVGSVRAQDFSEQSDGVALVLVQSSEVPPEVAQIVMRLEDGEWRIDLVSTELLWNRSWDLSGRSKRGDGMALDFDPLDRLEVQR